MDKYMDKNKINHIDIQAEKIGFFWIRKIRLKKKEYIEKENKNKC